MCFSYCSTTMLSSFCAVPPPRWNMNSPENTGDQAEVERACFFMWIGVADDQDGSQGLSNQWQTVYQLIGPVQRRFEGKTTAFSPEQLHFHQDSANVTKFIIALAKFNDLGYELVLSLIFRTKHPVPIFCCQIWRNGWNKCTI